MNLALGIDVGTSGVRAVALDAARTVVAAASAKLPPSRRIGAGLEQEPEDWWKATRACVAELARSIDLARVRRIAVDGTSGTLLLVDRDGRPLSPGLMYNDARATDAAARVARVAPPESGAHGPTAALAKLLHLLAIGLPPETAHAMHQADWIAGRLAGRFGFSDENNALKLGWDPVARSWPDWLRQVELPLALLPEVLVPGARVGAAGPEARALGLPADAEIRAGTTDGVAAFIATGADTPGDGVTSLGSTLVVKLLSPAPLFAPGEGVYSHRLGERWLAGGASNSGGAALLVHFPADRIEALSGEIDPATPSRLDYYPLPAPGERFPVADPTMAPRVTPRPADDARFLQGLLEGIAGIEAAAYRRLAALGGPALRRVLSVGGGAGNAAWTEIRRRRLGVPVATVGRADAAFGAALLAQEGVPP
jgi:hypothetical protein